jgi:chromosome segregation ATPase
MQNACIPPKPPKLSSNQKRKLKLRQKKEELEEERKQIGDWVRLECKELVNDVKKLEEQEEKRKQKKKEKLNHLIEIHKEIYKLRSKLGIIKADGKKTRLMSIM